MKKSKIYFGLNLNNWKEIWQLYPLLNKSHTLIVWSAEQEINFSSSVWNKYMTLSECPFIVYSFSKFWLNIIISPFGALVAILLSFNINVPEVPKFNLSNFTILSNNSK